MRAFFLFLLISCAPLYGEDKYDTLKKSYEEVKKTVQNNYSFWASVYEKNQHEDDKFAWMAKGQKDAFYTIMYLMYFLEEYNDLLCD